MPFVGDVIDRHFHIEASLGEGVAGQVFKVALTKPWKGFPVGSHFALKFFKDSVFEREPKDIVAKRRVREIQTGTSIAHPHLIKTYDTSEFNDAHSPSYLLMEYLEGACLDAYVAQSIVPPFKVGPPLRHNRHLIDNSYRL